MRWPPTLRRGIGVGSRRAIGVVAHLFDAIFECWNAGQVADETGNRCKPSPGSHSRTRGPDGAGRPMRAGGDRAVFGLRKRSSERRRAAVEDSQSQWSASCQGRLHGRCHCPMHPKTEEETHHSSDHDGKFVTG